MMLRTHFDKITWIRVMVESIWHIDFKFIFGNNHIHTSRDAGCVLTRNNINHTNFCDYMG